MAHIKVLDRATIDKIAAGEVVERPASIVKELVENALDADADAITVEIKNGGIDLIRVTDNGCGIAKSEVPAAFLRHATSKIESDKDLEAISSLGFRGEALSSIAAVTQLEVITKEASALTGTSYEIWGGEEKSFEDIGAPNGTTFLVRNIFYNTPARRKFLKTAMTEASRIQDVMEKLAMSHPDVSFRFLNNGATRLSTSGNGKAKDLIYALYGRETASELTEINYENDKIKISGFLGKPVLAKGNRGYENYYVNGRYVKSVLLQHAIEEAYRPFMMQHRYPFTLLYIQMDPGIFDVNVHPTKMELRFSGESYIYDTLYKAVREALQHKEFVPEVKLTEGKKEEPVLYKAAEPFEKTRNDMFLRERGEYDTRKSTPVPTVLRSGNPEKKNWNQPEKENQPSDFIPELEKAIRQKTEEKTEKEKNTILSETERPNPKNLEEAGKSNPQNLEEKPKSQELTKIEKPGHQELSETGKPVQQSFTEQLLSESGLSKHRLIGQLFETYWLIELEDKLYIMDQHAAHEKVLYERRMKELRERKQTSQRISPAVTITLTPGEELVLNRYMNAFSELGYEIASFGGKEYVISSVPADMYGLNVKELFYEILSDMSEETKVRDPEMVLSKLASLSCKAAVKGNTALSFEEAEHLIRELFTLENPYACPHGRPTLISMTKTEVERKFKRII